VVGISVLSVLGSAALVGLAVAGFTRWRQERGDYSAYRQLTAEEQEFVQMGGEGQALLGSGGDSVTTGGPHRPAV
jgi:hypothetical protein